MEHLHFYNSLQSPPDSTRARACVCVGRGAMGHGNIGKIR